MNAESLLVSVSINIGLALVILSLFSLLRKQPSNATIYFARRLSQHRRTPLDDDGGRSFTLRLLLPSVEWICRATRVTEEEILSSCGLDVLIFIRLFKLGINFFVVSSLIGLLVLLPLNYFAGSRRTSRHSHSMDFFTISNIHGGSNWLWVHFICLYIITFYGLHLLYKEYDDILRKRIQQFRSMRHQPNQFTVLVREIPLCEEHKTHGCSVDHFFSRHYPYSYQSYQILYDGKDLEHLLSQAKLIAQKIEDLKHRSSCQKHSRGSHPLGAMTFDAELDQLEKMIQRLRNKIQNAQNKNLLEQKELPVAFVTFRSRLSATLAAQSQQHSHPLVWITEMAPEPRDVLWKNLAIPYWHSPIYKLVVYVIASIITIFFAVPVAAVQGVAQFDRLRKWFPPAMAVQLIPGLRSLVTGYLPGVILSGFIYIAPFIMISIARFTGHVSRSKKDIRACNMVFYFLVGNVFFLSLLSGSLLDQIGEYFTHPRNFPSRLASAVSAQADFFMTYILTYGLSGFSLEVLQPGLLIWDKIKSNTWDRGRQKRPYLYSLPYYRVIPSVALSILIGMVYAVVSPLLLPFVLGYFLMGYVVYINQIQDVYTTTYETSGQYWPYIHHYILMAIIFMQITMIGLFGLKSKPSAAFSTLPLLIFTLLFNTYCKIRFLPTFYQYPVKDALENDELDEKTGLLEANSQNASGAYSPPCLQPLNSEGETSLIQPLISST